MCGFLRIAQSRVRWPGPQRRQGGREAPGGVCQLPACRAGGARGGEGGETPSVGHWSGAEPGRISVLGLGSRYLGGRLRSLVRILTPPSPPAAGEARCPLIKQSEDQARRYLAPRSHLSLPERTPGLVRTGWAGGTPGKLGASGAGHVSGGGTGWVLTDCPSAGGLGP